MHFKKKVFYECTRPVIRVNVIDA